MLFINKYIVALYCSLFFFVGFGVKALMIPLLVLVVLTLLSQNIVLGNLQHTLYLILTTSYVLMLYTFGGNDMTISNPLVKMLDMFVTSSVLLLLIANSCFGEQKRFVFFFFLGMLVYSLVLVFYTYFTSTRVTAYGLLFDPILNREVNSAGWATIISLSGSYISLYMFDSKKSVLGCGVFVVVVFSGLYLASRTALLFSLVSLLFLAFKFYRKNALFWFAIISLLCILQSVGYDHHSESINFTINRFLDEGLNSPRFELLIDGSIKLFEYPFGGFFVDVASYKGDWYHNILLDTGRVAGLIPVSILVIILVLPFVDAVSKLNNELSLVFFALLLCFFAMMQDVIMESYQLIFIAYILLGSMILNYKVKKF